MKIYKNLIYNKKIKIKIIEKIFLKHKNKQIFNNKKARNVASSMQRLEIFNWIPTKLKQQQFQFETRLIYDFFS